MDKIQSGAFFRFRKNEVIGNADAESDEKVLLQCFLDTGDLDALRDCEDPKRIVVGRTGAGKSALLRVLTEREEHVINLKPVDLSLGYLANSEVLKFFESAGAHLDVFYQLLWKHVIAVELIRYKYKITNESTQRTFLERLTTFFRKDKAKEQAVEYLRQWGANFWNETENRIKEVTTKIENDLRASISGSVAGQKMEAGGTEKLTEEEKVEVVSRGARAVNQVQIASLNNVLRLLGDDIFNDHQESYFVVIDDLDTHWVDDPLKYKLVRALIETCRAFKQVKRVKVVVALRLDLLQRVLTATKDSGFQSEKYEPLYLSLRWSNTQLLDLVNRRLDFLVKQRYTSKTLTIEDLFPAKIHHSRFKDFLCERTFLRPRDAILFVNECLARGIDRHQITVQMVSDAEASYSEKRLISLTEEWSGVYPKLARYLEVLTNKAVTFPASELSKDALEEWALCSLLEDMQFSDPVANAGKILFIDGKGAPFEFTLALIDALYVVGAIGVKPEPQMPFYWSYYSDHRPAPGSIKSTSSISVHPTFWRALAIASPVSFDRKGGR